MNRLRWIVGCLMAAQICSAEGQIVVGEGPTNYRPLTAAPSKTAPNWTVPGADIHEAVVLSPKGKPEDETPGTGTPIEPKSPDAPPVIDDPLAPAPLTEDPTLPPPADDSPSTLTADSFTYQRGDLQVRVVLKGSAYSKAQRNALRQALDRIPARDLAGDPAPEIRISTAKTGGATGSFDESTGAINLVLPPDTRSTFGFLEALGQGVGAYVRDRKLSFEERTEWARIADRSFSYDEGFTTLYTSWLLDSAAALREGVADVNGANNPWRLSGVLFMAARFAEAGSTGLRRLESSGEYRIDDCPLVVRGNQLRLGSVTLAVQGRNVTGAIVTGDDAQPYYHYFGRRVRLPGALLAQ